MAKFSPIAPPEYLRLLKAKGILGDYHLILAHDVVARPKLYEGLFEEDDFIIMDNSLCELGHPVEGSVMLEACQIVHASCAVLPDHLQEKSRTLMDSRIALDEWMTLGIHYATKAGFMCVPQGRTYKEVEDCIIEFSVMAMDDPINYYSIPKVIGEVHGSRMPIINYIYSHWKGITEPFVHLLGFSNSIKDDVECAKQSIVMGIDSAVPIRSGMNGTMMHLESTQHSPRGTYFEDASSIDYVSGLVDHNIDKMREWIK